MATVKRVIGNWKMHLTLPEAKDLLDGLKGYTPPPALKVGIAPSFPLIWPVAQHLRERRAGDLAVGAQNLHESDAGAYTGEVSARQLVDAGASFVLIGHSERRRHFGESEALIQKKIGRALEHHLTPVLCIGESLKERQEQRIEERLMEQLQPLLELPDLSHVVLAYEPVWAIGTGESATLEVVEEVHRFIKGWLQEKKGLALPVLYGGSVTADSAAPLSRGAFVDGFLVGGASLRADSFLKILQAFN
ncbi:MAG: triosephosphate isomerase [Chlamydiales bacterium]|jgi:triosephosphate isomerase|nr:triosephosphate isomerase [Chlamydiales bacterium]